MAIIQILDLPLRTCLFPSLDLGLGSLHNKETFKVKAKLHSRKVLGSRQVAPESLIKGVICRHIFILWMSAHNS